MTKGRCEYNLNPIMGFINFTEHMISFKNFNSDNFRFCIERVESITRRTGSSGTRWSSKEEEVCIPLFLQSYFFNLAGCTANVHTPVNLDLYSFVQTGRLQPWSIRATPGSLLFSRLRRCREKHTHARAHTPKERDDPFTKRPWCWKHVLLSEQ